MEGEFIIGAELDGQSVTLEPGGQFELSGALTCASALFRGTYARSFLVGAPVTNLHMTCAEVNSHLYQARLAAPARLAASNSRVHTAGQDAG